MKKGILINYDETLDTNGFHWVEVVWEHYQKYHLPVSYESFQEAYQFSEKAMRADEEALDLDRLADIIELKISYQFEWLKQTGVELDNFYATSIAEDCAYFADYTVHHAIPVLQSLSETYAIALLTHSPFNVKKLVDNFGVLHFFDKIVTSSSDFETPDPLLYLEGARALGLYPDECLVVATSLKNAVHPAKINGFQTIRLKGSDEGGSQEMLHFGDADLIISDLSQLSDAVADLSGAVNAV